MAMCVLGISSTASRGQKVARRNAELFTPAERGYKTGMNLIYQTVFPACPKDERGLVSSLQFPCKEGAPRSTFAFDCKRRQTKDQWVHESYLRGKRDEMASNLRNIEKFPLSDGANIY